MKKFLREAFGLGSGTALVAQKPTSRMLPVPRDGAHAGWLDRNNDSSRPTISTTPYLRTMDEEIRRAHRPVAAAARHLFTQSGFLQYGVELNCAWTVGGHGLEPSITVDAEALGWSKEFAKSFARTLEARFAEWSDDARSCDAQGRFKFGALQNAALRSYLGTGDILAVLNYAEQSPTGWRTSISLLDPSRLMTPPIWNDRNSVVKDGVEFNANGQALAYHIRPLPGHHETIRIPVYSNGGKRLVCHAFDAEPGAIRGISPLGAAINAITQSMNVHDAAVLASHVAAMVVGVVTSDLPSEVVARSIGGPDGNALAAMMEMRTGWHEALKKNNAHLQLGHGARIAHLSTGERFELLAGKVPFTEYEKIIRLGLAEAARALGLSPEFLHGLKDQATYSSLKVAAVEARAIMERRRAILIAPFAEWALWSVAEEAVADGRLPWRVNEKQRFAETDKVADFRRRRAAVKVEWRGPAIEDPDILKSTRAAIERLKFGLSSLSDEISATGKDPETVFRNRANDHELLNDYGLDLPWPQVPLRRT